jgi:hypothetical protein
LTNQILFFLHFPRFLLVECVALPGFLSWQEKI